MDIGGLAQGSVVSLFLAAIGWLFWKRAANQVKNTNEAADRDSRHQENIQDRLDSALQEVRRLSDELREAKDGKTILVREVKEAKRVNTILLEMLEKDQRESAQRWVKASKFADLEDLPKPRKD